MAAPSISRIKNQVLNWLFPKDILLSCMPFLPSLMPPTRRPTLEVRFVKKPHYQKWTDVHAVNYPGFQPVKGDDDDIVFRRGTLTVSCQVGEEGPKSDVQAIQFSDMRMQGKVTRYFELDLTVESNETLVTLELIHTSTQKIKFITRFQGYEATTVHYASSPSIDEIPFHDEMNKYITNKELLVPSADFDSLDPAVGSKMGSGSVEKQVDTEASVHTTDPEQHNIGSASSENIVEDVIRDSMGASDQQSVSIRIEKYGIEVQFHPSEIWSVGDIQAVPEVPAELVDLLTEDQAIICVGLKTSPSDAKFEYPVKVTMPHSAIFKRPDSAFIGTYHRKSSSDSFSLIAFASGDPRCDVRERDLDLYISHFSEWWIVGFITKLFVGKRVICTPFVPEPSPKNAKHLLRLCIRDSNRGQAEPESGYVTGIKGEEYFVAWRSGDLEVTCQVDDGDICTKTRRKTLFRTSSEVNVPFVVNTSAADTSKVFVQFILKQSATIEIICPMNLSGDSSSREMTADTRPSTSAGIPVQDASADYAGFSPKASEHVHLGISEIELHDLAEKLGNHTNLLKLALKLGFRQTTWMLYKASNTRRDGRICIDGTLDMLIDWKNDTPQVSQKALLNEALVFAGFAEFAGTSSTLSTE